MRVLALLGNCRENLGGATVHPSEQSEGERGLDFRQRQNGVFLYFPARHSRPCVLQVLIEKTLIARHLVSRNRASFRKGANPGWSLGLLMHYSIDFFLDFERGTV